MDPYDTDNIGEITGRYLDYDDSDKGMPMRSYEDMMMFGKNNTVNPHLDFDLFDKKRDISKVNYYDPFVSGSSNFSDINSDTRIITKNSLNKDITESLNYFAVVSYKSLKKRVSNKICFSPSNLLNFLVCLMVGSSDEFYKDIGTVFGNRQASDVIRFLETVKSRHDINMMLFPQNRPLNPAYSSLVSKLCIIDNMNINNEKTYKKINTLISKLTRGEINSLVTADKITDTILSVNAFTYTTVWKNFPCKIKKIQSKTCMVSEYTMQRFFSSGNTSLVELDLVDGCSIGFFKGDIDDLLFSMENLDYVNFIELCIPVITRHSKYNFNSVVQALGLDIFDDYDFRDISPVETRLGNIVQETRIEVKPSRSEHIRSVGKGIRYRFLGRGLCYLKKNNTIISLFEN